MTYSKKQVILKGESATLRGCKLRVCELRAEKFASWEVLAKKFTTCVPWDNESTSCESCQSVYCFKSANETKSN